MAEELEGVLEGDTEDDELEGGSDEGLTEDDDDEDTTNDFVLTHANVQVLSEPCESCSA